MRHRAPYVAVAAEIRLWCMGLSGHHALSPALTVPFIAAYTDMIEYVERVLAYFHFKKEEFGCSTLPQERDKVVVVTSLIERIVGEVAKQGVVFQEATAGNVLKVHALSHGFEQLTSVLDLCCGQLARLEGTKWLGAQELGYDFGRVVQASPQGHAR